MSTPMSAGQLLAQLQRWGIEYVTAPGWSTRNRNAYGAWGPVHGVLLHHTGDDALDDADQRVLVNGRSDLPGPLCHWAVRDDGTVVLIGWGRANHAGKGAANVRDALLTEDYGAYPPAPGEDSVDGNQLLYGQETMYSGLHAPTDAAYAATVRMFAAICDFHGWSGKSCIGHKEWTSRKPDPGHLDMAQFRRDVDALLEAGPNPAPAVEPTTSSGDEDDDMELISYGGAVYLRSGLLVRKVPGQEGQLAALVKRFGVVQAVTALEFQLYNELDTLLAIQRNAANSASTAAAAATLAAGQHPDVDEAQLAAVLAPLLVSSLPQQMDHLDDEDLAAIASAVNDQQDARERARLGTAGGA